MKKWTSLLKSVVIALALTPSVAVLAQVTESEKLMSQGNHNALTLDLPKVTVKYAEGIWKDFMKPNKGKLARDKKTDEWLADNATIVSIGGANTVDVYAKFTQVGENTQMTAWFDLGGGYVSSKDYREKYVEAEKLLLTYALQVAKNQTNDQLEAEQKNAKRMEKDLKGLEKDNEGLHKDIENWKAKIAKAEQDIQTNLKAQEVAKLKIAEQRKLIDEISKKLETLK